MSISSGQYLHCTLYCKSSQFSLKKIKKSNPMYLLGYCVYQTNILGETQEYNDHFTKTNHLPLFRTGKGIIRLNKPAPKTNEILAQ